MVAKERFGFDPAPVADLVHWTDIIDGALYADAATAVEMKEPAMKLTMVIESAQDSTFIPNSFRCWPADRSRRSLKSHWWLLAFHPCWSGTNVPSES